MPRRVRLPDGRYITFPDGTPDAVIDATIRSEMGTRQAELAPTQQEITEPDLASQMASGVGRSVGKIVKAPFQIAEMAVSGPFSRSDSPQLTALLATPPGAATAATLNLAKGAIYDPTKAGLVDLLTRAQRGGEMVAAGQPLAGVLEAARGLPVPGMALLNQIIEGSKEHGAVSAGAEAITDIGTQLLLLKKGLAPERAAVETRAANLARAVKPTGKGLINIQKAATSAIQDLRAIHTAKPIRSLADLPEAVDMAKNQVWAKYQGQLSSAEKAAAMVDGAKIADAIENAITPYQRRFAPKEVTRIKELADTWRKQKIPIQEADKIRRNLRDKVWENGPKQDPVLNAEYDGIRSELDATLEKMTGPGGRGFRERYGSLLQIEDAMDAKMAQLYKKVPPGLWQDAYGIFRMTKGVLGAAPSEAVGGAAHVAARAIIRHMTEPDALINRAFSTKGMANPTSALFLMRALATEKEKENEPD